MIKYYDQSYAIVVEVDQRVADAFETALIEQHDLSPRRLVSTPRDLERGDREEFLIRFGPDIGRCMTVAAEMRNVVEQAVVSALHQVTH